MLRIFVISLVVANLLLLGFQSSKPPVQPETGTNPATVRHTGIPTIHLFNEMVEDQGLLSGNRQCYTLGPFHSSEDRDDVHQRLLEVSTRISERRTEALVEKGYGVFMPPYASLLEANKALLSLQALGLNDIEIIYDGEWKNAIALGFFMRQENALKRKQGLESRGYQPILRVQRQAEPRYWLDYEQNPGSGLLALDLQNRPNDFMQRPVPCPETGFLETETVATQDPGLMPTEPQAPVEESGAVAVQGQAPDDSRIIGETPEQRAETIPDQITGESSVATQDPGLMPTEPEAPGDESGAVAVQGQAPDDSSIIGETPEEQVESVPEKVTGEPSAATLDPGLMPTEPEAPGEESAAVAVQAEAPDDSRIIGETPAEQVESVPEQVTGESSAEVEVSPKQAVGTGPEPTVSSEPVPLKDDTTDQADPQAPENDDGTGPEPTVSNEPVPLKDDTTEQADPQATENDGGTGPEPTVSNEPVPLKDDTTNQVDPQAPENDDGTGEGR